MLLASSQLIFCFLLIFLAFRVILYRIAFLIVVRVLLNRKPMKSSARPISLVTIFFFPRLSIVSTSYSFDNGKELLQLPSTIAAGDGKPHRRTHNPCIFRIV